MKRKLTSRWYMVVVLVLGVALLAVACGGGTATQEPPAAPEQPAVEEPKAEEPEATGGPPAIPHTLEGRDDCLVCHGEGGFKPFPADHSGRTNDTCQGCHQPAG